VIVYKVVRKSAKRNPDISYYGYDSRFIVAYMSATGDITSYSLEYELGKWTEAKIGMIYAFYTFKAARNFADALYSKSLLIMKAEADDISDRQAHVAKLISDFTIEHFWDNWESDRAGNFPSAPCGTVLCKRIKPIEVVYDSEFDEQEED
jgi:hypothetical protein